MQTSTTQGREGFLKDGQRCKVLLYQGKPLDIDIPTYPYPGGYRYRTWRQGAIQ